MMKTKRLGYLAPLAAMLCNLGITYILYFIARIIYLLVNYSYFEQGLSFSHLMEMLGGGLMFDTSAILVTNIPYIVLMLLPWHRKENNTYQQICKWVFVVINGLALAINLCDSVYFRYTMRRTTTTVFSEFSNEGNLGSIFLTETIRHRFRPPDMGCVETVCQDRPGMEASASLALRPHGISLFSSLCSLRGGRYPRGLYHRRKTHHHLQCQSICKPSYRGSPRTEYSLLALSHHW